MSAADIHPRIIAAAGQMIKDLDLQGDGNFGGIGERVYERLFPDETGLIFPCVMLTTEGEMERRLERDTETVSWQYPVRIWIADRESARKHEKKSLYMTWRKSIIILFDDQPLNGVPEAAGCDIVPEVIFDPNMPQYQHIISGMVLWVTTTEEKIRRPRT